MNYITQITIERYNNDKKYTGNNEKSNIVYGKDIDEALLDNISNINSETLIIVFGIGNGEYIEKTLNRIGKFNRLFIIEPDIDKIYNFINLERFEEIVEDPRLYIYLYKEKWELWDWLSGIIDEKQFNNIKLVTYSDYDKNYPKILLDVLKTIKNMLNKEWLNINTSKHLGMKFMKAYINNIKHILKSKPINELKGTMKGIPAVIVSGGPSLKKNIDKLKSFQDNVVIICGSRTLKPLLERGIKPDYICVLDTSDAMYELTENISYDNIPIVFQQSTNNKILDNHNGKKIFFKNNTFETYINKIIDYPIDTLFIGGSVAHTSADLGIYLGCEPIIFIGQDLALTNNEQYAFKSKNISEGYRNDHIVVKDINGMNVETSISLDDFRIAFESYIRCKQKHTFIDSTEGGAKIDGTLILTLQDTLNMFAKNTLKNLYLINDEKAIESYFDRNLVVNNLKKIMNVYEEVENRCKSGIEICKNIHESENESEILGKMKEIHTINEFIEECEELDFIDYATNSCLSRSFTLFGFENNDDSTISKSKKVSANFKFIYEYFLMCFKELVPLLKSSIEELDN